MVKKERTGKISSILCAVWFAVFSGFPARAQEPAPEKKLTVIATLFPLYDFAREISGSRAEVTLILPPGMEAHSFEPRPSDILKINNADIFIYTGRNMEPWVEGILKGVSRPDLLVIDASQGIAALGDPHIWLDLCLAQAMIDTVAAGFSRKDSAHAKEYSANARQYQSRLAELDLRLHRTFSGCRKKVFVYGGHSAWGYFARRYGLSCLLPYQGFSPDAQASPKAIAELIRKIKSLSLRYVYFEELVDPKIAKLLAAETGASILLLSGAHNITLDQFLRGVTFLEIMEENFENLKVGLECQ